MGVLRQHHRRLTSARAALVLLILAFASSAITHSHLSPIQQLEVDRKETEETKRGNWLQVREGFLIQRRLSGPGSAPPTCRSKCGKCSPCKAVRVPIQTNWKTLSEYYPEAWRCKCGNKYFMP